MKEPLLYLCHRMPFPPNKGDKITTYHILKFLSERFDVYLGCFIDDVDDNQYRAHVATFCKDACFVDLSPRLAKLKSIQAFVRQEPITLAYYRSTALQKWVDKTVSQHGIEKAIIYSGCMAQFVLSPATQALHKVIQFADVDSDKWRQYGEAASGVMKHVYLREYKTLAEYEKQITENFAVSCFISDAEVAMFKSMLPSHLHDRVKTLSNGVDSNYFCPQATLQTTDNTTLSQENYVVFTGAMDYKPNIDTVVWFIQNVWSEVVKHQPDAKFYVVGSSPPKQVQDLERHQGVVVTGRVEDVRPYLKNAKAAVAPMTMARGIQNKILEAMAMELPVLTTRLGLEGLEDQPASDLYITDSESEMIAWVRDKLGSPSKAAKESRRWLVDNYSWNAKLSPLLEYLEVKRA